MAHDVFISYSDKDKSVAEDVCAALESKHIRCWIAPRDIQASAVWAEAVVDAIDGSRCFLLIFSSDSNSSRQVVREVERAVAQGVVILPLRIDDAPMSKAMQFYIDRYHWLDARTKPLKKHLQQLSQTIQEILAEEHPVSETIQAPEEKERPVILKPQPILDVDCKGLGFTDIKPGSRTSKSFNLSNAGTGRLTGTIATNRSWLKVSPDRIDLDKGEKKVQVIVDTSGVAPGFDGAGEINIDTNGGQARVAVGLSTATLARPQPIGKPKARIPLRWVLISLGIVLFLVAGGSGVYFVSGHLFTPTATSTAETTPPSDTTPPETIPPETTPPSDTTPPLISKVTVAGYTGETATIIWETDEEATGQVDYGKTIVYGNLTATDGAMTTSHSVELTGLQPNTIYHFRVKSADRSGNQIVSGDNTFNSGVSQKDWAEYVNEEYGFSIQYPSDWVERPDILTVKDIHLAAFGVEGAAPIVACMVYDHPEPETKEWIVESLKLTGNTMPKVTSDIKEETLADGRKAYRYTANYISATKYEVTAYIVDADKGDKRIRVDVVTVESVALYDEKLFSQIAHTLRFTTDE